MKLRSILRNDLERYTEGRDWKYRLFKVMTSVGFASVVLIRTQEFLYRSRVWFLSYFFHRLNHFFHGIDVMPGAIIGIGLRIEHPAGIVIGAGVVIGENCTIMQGVTIGARNPFENLAEGNFPRIGKNVLIGANSIIVGPISVEDSVVIGAGSVVIKPCLANSTYVGNPARKVF